METEKKNILNNIKVQNTKYNNYKKIQLGTDEYNTGEGTIKKIFINDRYFFIYNDNAVNYNEKINLLLFYHGSRDIAINCILESTSLINTFGKNNWLIVFGQCDGTIQEPYISKYGKIAYGEIYWGITGLQNRDDDIQYTKNILQYVETKYKINKKVMLGHSNGGVFSLLIPIYLPSVFDIIISHQGGIGFDPYFCLDFHLVDTEKRKEKILFYTGTLDIHKSVSEQANNIFKAEGYKTDIIIIDKLDHNYKHECENIIKKWIEDNI